MEVIVTYPELLSDDEDLTFQTLNIKKSNIN